MITQLKLENFKCFDKETTFDLSKVNLFVGYNGRGKSSVIQSLLLLCQSQCHYGDFQTLEVNGDYVQLGLFEDLVNDNDTEKKPIRFIIKTNQKEGKEIRLGYEEKEDAERKGCVCELVVDGTDYLVKKAVSLDDSRPEEDILAIDRYPDAVNTLFQTCNYVSAERRGPSLYEEKCDLLSNNPLGRNGQKVLNVIAKNKHLINKINFWVDFIMTGGGLTLGGRDKDSAVLSLNMLMPNSNKKIKAINCGFGYSYVLSIVVNALTIEKGTLIIENPEAHLHPQAQIRLTKLLSSILDRDIQVLIETHSEHIVNGFRIYALSKDLPLNHDELNIYFFDEDFSIQHLKIESNGRIKNWPKGFFDQFEWEMTEIIRLGRENK